MQYVPIGERDAWAGVVGEFFLTIISILDDLVEWNVCLVYYAQPGKGVCVCVCGGDSASGLSIKDGSSKYKSMA